LNRGRCSGEKFEIRGHELVPEELSNVKFDLPQKKERFGQRLKLQAEIACGYHAHYPAIAYQHISEFNYRRDRVEQRSVRIHDAGIFATIPNDITFASECLFRTD